ncbi:MAG: hypothetical protein EBU93_00605 [Chlamydiae bacterium]|nr:hypothetical protein [Chlamydiota bacterium]
MVSQVSTPSLAPQGDYHASLHGGSMAVTSHTINIFQSSIGAANAVGGCNIEAPSANLGLARSLTVLSGISGLIYSVKLLKASEKIQSLFAKFQASFKITKSTADILTGGIGTFLATAKVAGVAILENQSKILDAVGDISYSIGAFIKSVSSFLDAGMSGNIRRMINRNSSSELIKELEKLSKEAEGQESEGSIFSKEEKKFIRKEIGQEALAEFQSLDLKDAVKKIEDIKKKFLKDEVKNTVVGIVSLISATTVLILDFLSLGIFTKILKVLKPTISFILALFDLSALKGALNKKTEETTASRYVRYAITILSISIAVATYLTASIGSGGIVPLISLILGCALPLITLLLENKHQILDFCKSMASRMMNRENLDINPLDRSPSSIRIETPVGPLSDQEVASSDEDPGLEEIFYEVDLNDESNSNVPFRKESIESIEDSGSDFDSCISDSSDIEE